MIRINATDTDYKVAGDDLFIDDNPCSQGRSAYFDEIVRRVMHKNLTRRGCFRAYLFLQSIDSRCAMRPCGHQNSNSLSRYAPISKMPQQEGHHTSDRRRSV